MRTWARTGPVVVEVDGSAEGLRVVDYACVEALRSGAELVLAAAYPARNSFTSKVPPGFQDKAPAELADDDLRIAVAHVRRQVGFDLQLKTASVEGSRLKVLPRIARHARLLVVGRTRTRGPHRLLAAQGTLLLAARIGCPVTVVPMSWKPSAIDRTVAVGVDGTPLSLEAVEFAFRTAADRDGDLAVVHASDVAHRTSPQDDVADSWVRRADLTVGETLAGWVEEYPEVKVTRFLTGGPVVPALVHEGRQAGLVVVGAYAGLATAADPVARRAIAAMPCPVAIVPHHVTAAEREQRRRETQPGTDFVITTY
jgi:nucleotide-binding universal stress UspA family protein